MNSGLKKKTQMEKRVRSAATVLCLLPILVLAQVPLQFSYQGRLTDDRGVPVTGAVTGVFRIIKGGDAMGGGDEVFAETNNTVQLDANGVFSMMIGDGTANFLAAVHDGTTSNRFIEAVINGETNKPRQQLVAVPYAIHAFNGVPSGTILTYGGLTPPHGFLHCDGTSYPKTQYPLLYAAIQNAFGEGVPDANYFNVPDLRGMFLRGVDHGAGNDPDAADRIASKAGGNSGDHIGSSQDDELETHSHLFSRPLGPGLVAACGACAGVFHSRVDSLPTGDAGGNETRPSTLR